MPKKGVGEWALIVCRFKKRLRKKEVVGIFEGRGEGVIPNVDYELQVSESIISRLEVLSGCLCSPDWHLCKKLRKNISGGVQVNKFT